MSWSIGINHWPTPNFVNSKRSFAARYRIRFACTACFMSLRDSDYGCICLHDPDNGAIFLIGRSFEAFRARLYMDSMGRVSEFCR